jgi:hypothetical protein
VALGGRLESGRQVTELFELAGVPGHVAP